MSQGWVEEDVIEKSFTSPSGTVIPSTTQFYKITAAGIDKIEGPGEFTMPKFHGIKIEATGQNIITLGDGNQIDVQFGKLGNGAKNASNSMRLRTCDKFGCQRVPNGSNRTRCSPQSIDRAGCGLGGSLRLGIRLLGQPTLD